MLRVGVLASGNGTNFDALFDACVTSYAKAEIAVVLTDKADAGVHVRAAHAGVECRFVNPAEAPDRQTYDKMLTAHMKMYGVDLVCAAGWMRLLSPGFVAGYRNRILNVHPSLLPAFPGLDAIGQAWEWGAKVTGATVHVIDEELDHGPIVFQQAVDVLGSDTVETLTERIHLAEYTIYPKALRFWASTDAIQVAGRRVVIESDIEDPPWSPGLPPSLEGGM